MGNIWPRIRINFGNISNEYHVIEEVDQIIWAWEQGEKRHCTKGFKTRYWLNIVESCEGHLLNNKAYELLAYLKLKAPEEKRRNRANHRVFMQAKAQLELAKYEEWVSNWKLKRQLTSIVNNLN